MRIRNVKLGKILASRRKDPKYDYTLKGAASLLGFCSDVYLWRCETGRNSFPAKRMKRASEIYSIPMKEMIEAATEDYRDSLTKFLGDE